MSGSHSVSLSGRHNFFDFVLLVIYKCSLPRNKIAKRMKQIGAEKKHLYVITYLLQALVFNSNDTVNILVCWQPVFSLRVTRTSV